MSIGWVILWQMFMFMMNFTLNLHLPWFMLWFPTLLVGAILAFVMVVMGFALLITLLAVMFK